MSATAAQREAIAGLPFVDHLQPVARGSRMAAGHQEATTSLPDYNLTANQLLQIGVPYLHACGLDGTGVVIAVQDTGFHLEHDVFAGLQVLAERDFINDDDTTANETEEESRWAQDSHGTQVLSSIVGEVAGIYRGAAPGVSVILSKTEAVPFEEPVEEDWFVEGLEWAEAQGADVFTASLGYLDWYESSDLDGATAVTTLAATIALENGLILVNSAGNGGPDAGTLSAPADTDGLIAVGAVDRSGETAMFSSRGPTADGRIKPDVAAPGVSVWTALPHSGDEYTQVSGTSFAGPLTAGAVALLLQAEPGLSPAAVLERLRTTASQADDPDNTLGWGIVNMLAAVGSACACDDLDGDGELGPLCGGADCNDLDDAIHPGAPERCNLVDDNCDGRLSFDELDGDHDGYPRCLECDDTTLRVSPVVAERCHDGLDNNCDGLVDHDDPTCSDTRPLPSEDLFGPGCGCAHPAPRDAWNGLLLVVLIRRRR
ncbi:MAG: S8 family serine peptidase [Deltaproteobacteria bacterium]|nr:S8 family serine peptidase [Deltaproteobacteria bacterium]